MVQVFLAKRPSSVDRSSGDVFNGQAAGICAIRKSWGAGVVGGAIYAIRFYRKVQKTPLWCQGGLPPYAGKRSKVRKGRKASEPSGGGHLRRLTNPKNRDYDIRFSGFAAIRGEGGGRFSGVQITHPRRQNHHRNPLPARAFSALKMSSCCCPDCASLSVGNVPLR